MDDERMLKEVVDIKPPKSIDVFFAALLHRESLKNSTGKDKVEHHSVFMKSIANDEQGSIVLVGNHVYKRVEKGWRTTKNLTTVELIDSEELVDIYLDYMNSM